MTSIPMEFKGLRICFISLSPSSGMLYYLADLANCMCTDHCVGFVSAQEPNLKVFAPQVEQIYQANVKGTGFDYQNVNLVELHRIEIAVRDWRPDVIHITSPHIWNHALVLMLRRTAPVVLTLHDPDLHPGQRFRLLAQMYNKLLPRFSDHVLIHGNAKIRFLVLVNRSK